MKATNRTHEQLATAAEKYVKALCDVKPNRRTGSAGNRAATSFFAATVSRWAGSVHATPFPVPDYEDGTAMIAIGADEMDLFPSPYSMPVDIAAPLSAVSTVDELRGCVCEGKVLLLHGEICNEQLMPRNFPFYNPEHHQELYALLEERAPAGIITATGRSPEQVGALYPYPLIVDGDFNIPVSHCTDETGRRLAEAAGQNVRLCITGRRMASEAANVVARIGGAARSSQTAAGEPGAGKIVVTAHIDAYENSPGASDNASGTATLLLIAELLSDYDGPVAVEIVAMNGEDHFSAAGEKDYLERYGNEIDSIRLLINIDDIGYRDGGTSYSLYECSRELAATTRSVLGGTPGMEEGDPWYSGDHMVFVMQGRPAVAFTASLMPELMKTITHTEKDTPEILDPTKLVHVAKAIATLCRRVGGG